MKQAINRLVILAMMMLCFTGSVLAQNTLTMSSPVYDSTGQKFGTAALSSGYGADTVLATTLSGLTTFTVEAWIKTSSTANLQIAVAYPALFWIGKDGSDHLEANYQAGGNLSTTSNIADGNWHHVALSVGASGAKLFLDGAIVASNGAAQATITPNGAVYVGTYQNTTYPWVGEVDEPAFWSTNRYTTAFTPPSSAYTGTEAGLISLYHLDSNGNDSKQTVPGAPTALTATPSNNQVSLSWTGSTGANSYNVKRSTTSGSGYTTITTAGAVTGTSYVDTTAVNGTAYYYVVSAVSGAGESANSSQVGPETPFVAAPNVLPNSTALLYSPYNWVVTSGAAKTINAGAYFRTIIGGTTSCNIDMTIGTATPYSEVEARLDAGPWQVYIPTASGAQEWSLTMPTGTTAPKHLLEFLVKSTTETQDRWNTQTTATQFTGLSLDSGYTVTLPAARKYRVLLCGDSISEGVRVNGYNGITNDTDRNDNALDYSYALGALLNAEIGVVGFGATGLTVAGSGNVPTLPASYNYEWSGQARTFSPVPDLAVFNEGTNDSSATSAAIGSALMTVATGVGYAGNVNTYAGLSGTRQLWLRPLNGTQASAIQAAVTAINNHNVVYGDTTGFWNSADSSDGLHPYGYSHLGQIAPQIAPLAMPLLHPTGTSGTKRRLQ